MPKETTTPTSESADETLAAIGYEPGGRRPDAGGVARGLGARRGAGQALPGEAGRRPGPAGRGRERRRRFGRRGVAGPFWTPFWHLNWPVLLIGVCLVVFARIMKEGVRMREDLEGTV